MAVSRLSSANLAVAVGKSDRPEAPKGLLWAASSLTDLHNFSCRRAQPQYGKNTQYGKFGLRRALSFSIIFCLAFSCMRMHLGIQCFLDPSCLFSSWTGGRRAAPH